jgi:hypothetical protein
MTVFGNYQVGGSHRCQVHRAPPARLQATPDGKMLNVGCAACGALGGRTRPGRGAACGVACGGNTDVVVCQGMSSLD